MQPFEHANIKISYLDTELDSFAIYPRIKIRLEILYTYSAPDFRSVVLDDFIIHLRYLLREKERRIHFIGNLFVDTPYIRLETSRNCVVETFLDLDFYRLNQIEKLREGKNLAFQVSGKFFLEMEGAKGKTMHTFWFEIRIPKSQWVEDILSKTGFKNVSLLEIPRLPTEEYRDVVKWVDNAWKQYMMGEYDKVLGDCRKALEGLTKIVKDKGFEKTIVEDDKKRKLPDWRKFFSNEDLGDIFGTVTQKMFGFMTVGAHFGKGINREDADLALMIIHSMTNFVIKKTP